MSCRVQKDGSLYYVVENDDDTCVAVFGQYKKAKWFCDDINTARAFQGPIPAFLSSAGPLDYTNGD